MRTTALLLLGAAPGVGVAYLLLVALLLRRIKPLPITFLPEAPRNTIAELEKAVA